MRRALTWRRLSVAALTAFGAALLGLGVWQENTSLAILGVALWVAATIEIGLILLRRVHQIRQLSASAVAPQESAGPKEGGIKKTSQSATPIFAGMASIPGRVLMLEQAVASIYDQIDHLFVYLNNYEHVPSFLQRDRISVFTSEAFGDIRDSGKFYGLTRVREGIYLSLDDDIRYPPDYARTMKKAVQRFNNKCVVGVHGIVFPTLVQSFFDRKLIHFRKQWEVTAPVSALGTGTTAFAIQESGISFDIFKHHGMADVSLALYLKEHRIPGLVVRRNAGWLDSLSGDDDPSLYGEAQRDSTGHTEAIVKARPWGLEDLCERVEAAGIESLLPGRWRAVVSACRAEEGAVEALGEFPLAILTGLIRTFSTGCETWSIAKGYVPKRAADVPRHCSLLKDCLALNPEGVLALSHETCQRRWEQGDIEASLHYAGAYIAALRKLVMYDEADEFWIRLESRGPIPADVAAEYLRLKAQEGAHEAVIALAREYYPKLSYYGDFVPLVYGAVAHLDGVQAAVHAFAPSFGQQGRTASRRRRAIIAACCNARVTHPGSSLDLDFAAAETSAAQSGNIYCVRDLSLFYIAIGERRRARQLLERYQAALDQPLGPDLVALMFAATADDSNETVDYINKYNAYRGLAPIEASKCRDRGSFFSSLSVKQPLATSGGLGKVSVVIAAFNAAATIGYAVRSILAQSYRDLEVIVVDDASSDGTWEELESLRQLDLRVRPVRNRSNVGPYVCRNIALEMSDGPFVAIHDADDLAHPQRFERQIDAFNRSEVVAVLARHLRLDKDGFIALENNGEIIGHGPVTLMCRRSVFEEIGPFRAVRTRGDIEFRDRMRYCYGAHRLVHLDDVLVYALHDSGSNSHAMTSSPEARRNLELFRAHYNRRLVSMRSVGEIKAWRPQERQSHEAIEQPATGALSPTSL